MASDPIAPIVLQPSCHSQQSFESTYQRSEDPWGYYSFADQVRFQKIAQAARAWSPHPRRSLDVACGLGQVAELLAEFSQEVFAYDFAPSAVQRTRERFQPCQQDRIHVEVRDALCPGYDKNMFDLIVMSDIDTDANLDWYRHVIQIHKELLAADGTMVIAGRIKKPVRRDFEANLVSLGGTILDRIFFHDRYWFKARSFIRRVLPTTAAKRCLSQGWLFRSTESLGALAGPSGSIHFGIVVRFQ